jgi:hypothetical protein
LACNSWLIKTGNSDLWNRFNSHLPKAWGAGTLQAKPKHYVATSATYAAASYSGATVTKSAMRATHVQ